MAIDRKFPRYPNYTFLQLEEINQTLYNYLRDDFHEWYCIDFSKIVKKFPSFVTNGIFSKSFTYLRYDFVIISLRIDTDSYNDKVYTYTFEIRNQLWTGNWKITTLDDKVIDPSQYFAETTEVHGNTFTIQTKSVPMFKLCLELSNDDVARNIPFDIEEEIPEDDILETVLTVNSQKGMVNGSVSGNETECMTVGYYNSQGDYVKGTSNTISGTLTDENGNPVKNQTIEIYIANRGKQKVTTNSSGVYSYTYTENGIGEFNVFVFYQGVYPYNPSSAELSYCTKLPELYEGTYPTNITVNKTYGKNRVKISGQVTGMNPADNNPPLSYNVLTVTFAVKGEDSFKRVRRLDTLNVKTDKNGKYYFYVAMESFDGKINVSIVSSKQVLRHDNQVNTYSPYKAITSLVYDITEEQIIKGDTYIVTKVFQNGKEVKKIDCNTKVKICAYLYFNGKSQIINGKKVSGDAPIKNKDISFKIGKFKKNGTTDKDGKVCFEYTPKTDGILDIESTFKGDSYYNSAYDMFQLTVKEVKFKPQYVHRKIRFEKTLYTKEHQYNKEHKESFKVLDADTNKPVEFAEVTFVALDSNGKDIKHSLWSSSGYNYLAAKSVDGNTYKGMTNSKGIVTFNVKAVKTAGIRKARLDAYVPQTGKDVIYSKATCSTTYKDDAIQNYEVGIDLSDTDRKMYKGEIKKFPFKLVVKNKYGQPMNNPELYFHINVYHTLEKQQSPLMKSKGDKEYTDVQSLNATAGTFHVKLSSREFWGNKSKVKIQVQGIKSAGFPSVSKEFSIKHEWFYVNDYEHLRKECANSDGCDAIILLNKVYTRPAKSESIHIKRKQFIIGQKGNNFATINGNGLGNLFIMNPNNAKTSSMIGLYLNGLKIANCENVVYQKRNTYLQLLNCVFTENKYVKSGYQGAVVYQSEQSCAVDINNCYFSNDYGNNVFARGKTLIDSCLFKITDVKYTYQPEPFCLEQISGEGIVKNNQFYCNTGMDYSSGKMKIKAYNKNRSFAKISVRVGVDGKVNGKDSTQLEGDDTFNFFDAPYNNKSYVFSIYWYPYEVNDYLVCSCPLNHPERINRCTGHTADTYRTKGDKRRFAWGDGYDRWELPIERYKHYDTRNPFITLKDGKIIEDPRIYVPTSGGAMAFDKKNTTHNTDRMG